MKHHATLIAIAGLLFVNTLAMAADSVQDIIMHQRSTVPAQSGGVVRISSDRGDVKIRTWNQNKVVVRSEAVHNTIVVNATAADGSVNVDAHGYTDGNVAGQIVHVIYVPVNSKLEVMTSNGNLTLDDPNNTLSVKQITPTL